MQSFHSLDSTNQVECDGGDDDDDDNNDDNNSNNNKYT
jgi:hypothetical protein